MLEADLEPKKRSPTTYCKRLRFLGLNRKPLACLRLEVIQGAPYILEILKGPLKKLVKRKTKVISNWQEQGKISTEIDPELLILNIWALTQKKTGLCHANGNGTGKTLRNHVCNKTGHSTHRTYDAVWWSQNTVWIIQSWVFWHTTVALYNRQISKRQNQSFPRDTINCNFPAPQQIVFQSKCAVSLAPSEIYLDRNQADTCLILNPLPAHILP